MNVSCYRLLQKVVFLFCVEIPKLYAIFSMLNVCNISNANYIIVYYIFLLEKCNFNNNIISDYKHLTINDVLCYPLIMRETAAVQTLLVHQVCSLSLICLKSLIKKSFAIAK